LKGDQVNAAELFVKCLEAEGVEYVFGLPGEENAHVMLALEDPNRIRKQSKDVVACPIDAAPPAVER
jgi:hypothetical protein